MVTKVLMMIVTMLIIKVVIMFLYETSAESTQGAYYVAASSANKDNP